MSATTFTFSTLLPAARLGLANTIEGVSREGVAHVVPMSESLLQAADAELRRALAIPLPDVFGAAWEKALEVGKAIARSRKSPEKIETVRLGAHEIVGTEHPELVFELNGQPIGKARLDLEFKATLEGAILGIANGALSTVEMGVVRLKLSLKANGGTILPDWEPKPIHLPGVMTFGPKPAAAPAAN